MIKEGDQNIERMERSIYFEYAPCPNGIAAVFPPQTVQVQYMVFLGIVGAKFDNIIVLQRIWYF